MFVFKLEDAINELGITKNKLSVESKVRSNTIIDLAKGNVSRIDFYSLQAILDTLNSIAKSKGLERKFNLNDIVQYEYEGKGRYYIKVSDEVDMNTIINFTTTFKIDDNNPKE